MGGVIVSPNIKRESVRINPAGDIIDARTKQIIKPVELEYVPSVAQEPIVGITHPEMNNINQTENKIGSKIDEMINKKIEELVAKKIEEALSKL